ncbi:hypothetical protein M9978_17270 [Sphingomonas sp. MG17]|uniref:Uncharacterized protein n=1 Tax=Sphingomonas tagetis TaxID=2949092 RepID=A0A9X2KN54_9SPHN|nr:hypothetical protein [Sphingomonas tagetis]MCP3732176.1 hypothetical protein [Sphingomonas tagetis]
MDLLIEAHCHLIRSTRQMLAWGTTLQLAVLHLETIPTATIAAKLRRLPSAGLNGSEKFFLGAPKGLGECAAGIAAQISIDGDPPTIVSIYLVALQISLDADPPELLAALERARRTTPARLGPKRM